MWEAADGRVEGEIDFPVTLLKDDNREVQDGEIAPFFGKSLFNSTATAEEHGFSEDHEGIEFGDDPPAVIKQKLEQGLKKAVRPGFN